MSDRVVDRVSHEATRSVMRQKSQSVVTGNRTDREQGQSCQASVSCDRQQVTGSATTKGSTAKTNLHTTRRSKTIQKFMG